MSLQNAEILFERIQEAQSVGVLLSQTDDEKRLDSYVLASIGDLLVGFLSEPMEAACAIIDEKPETADNYTESISFRDGLTDLIQHIIAICALGLDVFGGAWFASDEAAPDRDD